MKILVPCKRCIDYNVAVHIKDDHTGVVTDGVKMSMNPFDEIALEEAIRLKEKGVFDEVILITIDEASGDEVLKHGLAMGADTAYRISQEAPRDPWVVASYLKEAIKQLDIQLVLMGKLSIDGDHSQTGPLLAGFLDWPQATFASKITYKEEKIEVIREVDEGLETAIVSLPAVITSDLRLNTPRYIALPNLIKARQKPIHQLNLSKKIEDRTQLIKVDTPSKREQGEIFTEIEPFIQKLQDKGVL